MAEHTGLPDGNGPESKLVSEARFATPLLSPPSADASCLTGFKPEESSGGLMDTLTKSWQEYEAAHALDGNRPTKDTGFRMKPQPPFSYTRVDRAIPYKRIWAFDHFHNDDLKDDGRALNAVRFVVPDCDAAAARNQKYLLESIGLTSVIQ